MFRLHVLILIDIHALFRHVVFLEPLALAFLFIEPRNKVMHYKIIGFSFLFKYN